MLALSAWITSVGAQEPPPRDEANAAFWWRIDHPASNPLDAPYASYRPLARLAGAPGPFLPTADPGRTTLPAPALDEAARFVASSQGKALIVVHRGVVQLERYFDGSDAETAFSAHSMAKTLGAAALGVALREGHIQSLDQPASTWLTEWRDPARAGITLRQLLTMSGGFRNLPSKDLGSHYIQLHYGADVEAIVRAAPVAYAPGSDFAWDNDNSHALGLVIERATGQRYLDYVSAKLWQPLGASDAEQLLDRSGGRAMAYCCVWSRPRDWVRLGQMLLDEGRWQGRRLLDEAFVRALRAPSAANPLFGFQVNVGPAWQDPRLNRRALAQGDDQVAAVAPDLFYLSGVGGQQLVIVPSEQLVILRVGKASPAWRDHVLPNLLAGALRAGAANQR
ncbi:serine hydrolase domain-containing protein [Aquabacterium sp. OR-4]|uniref:serine hydrolase domain-containing protein n=1 Tax=Aquabacterium sp. OR-4 TaxID=2978127 RepID=UPI0021B3DA2C|nr:serine hydrolase [Aquabacterium sp. OR-4]MDT7836953.1 serine hydrolase [Aquabacterium sp. OR-4]